MKISKLLLSLLIFTLSSCGDIFTPTKKIDGPYYLSESEDGNYWTLYYQLDDSSGHGRVDSVHKIGWTDNFIFVENNNRYYFIDKEKDQGLLNADEIVIGPFGHNQFVQMLDSLKLQNFSFQLSF